MKLSTSILALLMAILILPACSDDDNNPAPSGDGILSYDGPNSTGPNLDPGVYQAAAMFPSSLTVPLIGKNLTKVSWFMGNRPARVLVKVYGEGSNAQPGVKLYEADVTNTVASVAWTTHTLTSPIEITGDDIWVSIEFEHSTTMQSMGCDDGPAQNNGDWLFQSSDAQWLTFRDRTNENINWNIRATTE